MSDDTKDDNAQPNTRLDEASAHAVMEVFKGAGMETTPLEKLTLGMDEIAWIIRAKKCA